MPSLPPFLSFLQPCSTKFSRNRHERTHESLEGRLDFVCQICNKGYTESGNLTRHIKKIHLLEKPGKREKKRKEKKKKEAMDPAQVTSGGKLSPSVADEAHTHPALSDEGQAQLSTLEEQPTHFFS